MLFEVEIDDLGVDVQAAIAAWDEVYPIPTIPLGDDDIGTPKFASRKEHIEDMIKSYLLNKLDHALHVVAQNNRVTLTKDIFKRE